MDQIVDFFRKLSDTSDWPPRWHCGKWSDFHGWLYIVSDLLVWSAYFCIPLLIVLYVSRRRHEIRFQPVFLLFASFILACGTTHFLDALMFWYPAYRISALVRLVTGLISWTTVFYLIRIMPQAFSLKSPKLLEREVRLREGAESELRLRNQQLEEAQRLGLLGSWHWDLQTEKITWSEGLFQIWERPYQPSLTLDWFMETLVPGDRQRVQGLVQQALVTGIFPDFHFRITTPSGRVKNIFARGKIKYNEEGQPIEMLGTDQDVTNLKVLEEELKRKNAQLEEAQHLAQLGYWQYDMVRNEISWSAEMYRIWGFPAGSRVSLEAYYQTIHPADLEDLKAHIQRALEQKEYPDFYHRIIHQETGEVRHVFARGEVITDELGKPVRLNGTSQDVTRQRNNELQILAKSRQLERTNAELESFAYVASHDLQEPLRKVQTFASMLVQDSNSHFGKNGQLYLEKITSSAERMQRLIHDILEFSRLASDATRFAQVSIRQTVLDIMSNFEIAIRDHNATIVMGDLPVLEALPTQMEQLFQNLIGNALKFHNPGQAPEIRIEGRTCKGQDLPEGQLERLRDHHFSLTDQEWNQMEFCTIRVSDNGIGFDAQYAEKIFAIFQRLHPRTAYEGTGIGLAVCKKIVDNHHGIITAFSEPGRGATFEVILPATQAPYRLAI